MSINHFLQIFWARRIFIVLCTLACLAGAVVICSLIPPVWQAEGKVLLNLGKADPVTGESTASRGDGNSLSTQMNFITQPAVMNKAVDALGWPSDPNLIYRYEHRSKKDKRDFRAFLTDNLAASTIVRPVGDSTIMSIAYNGATPDGARAVVQAIIDAYVAANNDLRSGEAQRDAQFYEGELQRVKAKLDEAVAAETAYERQTGIVMANDKNDVESARLASLAGAGNPIMMMPTQGALGNEGELANVEAQLAAASKTLGPNNPEMIALEKKRADTLALIRKDEAANRALRSETASGASQTSRELAQAKKVVVADSEKIGRLQTLQQDVDVRRQDYTTAAAKYATYKAQADQTQSNAITVLGVSTPHTPLYPNWTLSLVGSIAVGLALGLGVTLLLELINPKVRSPEDLENRIGTPVVAVVASPPAPRRSLGVRGAAAAARRANRTGAARA